MWRHTHVAAEYGAWTNMRNRCHNPDNEMFEHYGGRGIAVSFRWQSFEQFLEDVGPRPSPKHSLDRIDVNGDYEPGNVRWTEWVVQANNKTDSVYCTHNGKTQTLAQWAQELGINYCTVRKRFRKGQPIDQSRVHLRGKRIAA